MPNRSEFGGAGTCGAGGQTGPGADCGTVLPFSGPACPGVRPRGPRGGGQAPDLPGDGSAQAERAGRI
jgi:hypothetical protein